MAPKPPYSGIHSQFRPMFTTTPAIVDTIANRNNFSCKMTDDLAVPKLAKNSRRKYSPNSVPPTANSDPNTNVVRNGPSRMTGVATTRNAIHIARYKFSILCSNCAVSVAYDRDKDGRTLP